MELRFDAQFKAGAQTTSIADLTAVPYTVYDDADDPAYVVMDFEQDIDAATRSKIAARLTDNANEVTIRSRLDAAINQLQQITNSSGTLTTAQLSDAVRVVAKVCLGLVRIVIRRLESAD